MAFKFRIFKPALLVFIVSFLFIAQQQYPEEPSQRELQKLEEKWLTIESWSASYNENYSTDKTWEIKPGVNVRSTIESNISGTYKLEKYIEEGYSSEEWYGYGNGSYKKTQTVVMTSEVSGGTIVITEKIEESSSGAIGDPAKNEYGEFWGGNLYIDIYSGTYNMGFAGPETDGKSTLTRTVEGLPTDYSELEKLPEVLREIFVPLGQKAEEWATYSGPLEDAEGMISIGGLFVGIEFPDLDEKDPELPKSGTMLKGSYKSETTTRSWTISPGGKNELLVLEKAPKEWIPDKETPEPLIIKVTGNGVDGEKVKIRFTLFEVTREIGYCLNSLDKNEDLDLDFYPDATANYFDPPEETDDGWIIETDDKVLNASVGIFAWDWGAWGKLKAEYELDEEEDAWYPITCADGKDYITIPLDERGGIENHIADQFELDYDLKETTPGRYDGERGENPGDGLTAYEEYRGFMIGGDQGKHIRTNPELSRDLFFFVESPKIRSHLQNEMPTGNNILIHLLNKYTDFVDFKTRVINPNRGNHSLGAQHGLWMYNSVDTTGLLGYANTKFISPETTSSVVLYLNNFPKIIKKDEIRVTAIHEIMHGCGVRHHGLTNEEDVLFGNDYLGSIAYWDGVNAGDITCVMQYGTADYFYREDGTIAVDTDFDLIEFEDTDGEILYTNLCTKKIGNGLWLNSQLGPANKGECLKQVRIADH